MVVASNLVKKVGLKLQKEREPNVSDDNQNKELVAEFLCRTDMVYTAPGMHDKMTIWENENVTIKDVIYWVLESWDNVTQNCLVKSWKKLWPSLADSSKVEQGETNKSEILTLIKCIPVCEDATEHTVTERLSCDTEVNQLYTDEEIISLVQNKPQDDSYLEETD
ncbi:hypothetical protein AVEN_29072-1 [Araneus ventricosus]|uniref:DDE-1 domain-containing protein n=1 Tax=Araneus ventricosus TaxID=182803 RepID=A0A4Y2ALE8_ARAVE|nr:hypothetical protein AVEN_29072-1 [Araneus ventricosus]